MSDARQLISEIHGATLEVEFERVAAKVQARFPNTSNPIDVLSILQPELTFARRLVAQWKSDFLKGSRPPQYQAKKELVALLEQEIAFWQGKTHHSAPAAEATTPEVVDAPKLSLRQVALFHIYCEDKEGIKHGAHANDIAGQYINPKTGQRHKSGQRLYGLYNDLQNRRNRIDVMGKQIKPLIKDIEAVLPYLAGRFKQNAESELSTLLKRI